MFVMLAYFQPRIDFYYGLDVEIRPKLTPGAGTQVQYRTALWLHGHVLEFEIETRWMHFFQHDAGTHGEGRQ